MRLAGDNANVIQLLQYNVSESVKKSSYKVAVWSKNNERPAACAGLRPGDSLVDLFCGSGAMALGLARACSELGFELGSVVGADACAPAVRDGAANAAHNGMPGVRFLEADLDQPAGVAALAHAAPRPDVVVAGELPQALGLSSAMSGCADPDTARWQNSTCRGPTRWLLMRRC